MLNAVSSFLIALLMIIVPNILFKNRMVKKDMSEGKKKEVMKNANYYVMFSIAAFFIICPWIMQVFPESYTITAQICLGILVLVMDWPSLYQDKTRFSEEKACLFGNCRKNALITGIAAHLADVLGVALGIWTVLNKKNNVKTQGKLVLILTSIVYSGLGVYFIHYLTKKGSESDLRNLSEEEKCKRNRIMKDEYRGVLNLVITFFGVFIGWQAVMEIGNGSTPGVSSNHILFSWINEIMKFGGKTISGNATLDQQSGAMMRIFKAMFVIAMGIVPTYANNINTTFQYSAPASDLKLPDCFD
tara:strand:- start:947 stop:1852 length:906 start_codon:yes stop_codon:yes gene_type:complete